MKHIKKFNEYYFFGESDTLTNPDLNDGVEKFFQEIGVNITPAQEGQEPNVNIRINPNMNIYGFKFEEDLQNLKEYADTNEFVYEIAPKSEGARYQFHLIIKK